MKFTQDVVYRGPMPQSPHDYYRVSSLNRRTCCVYILSMEAGPPVYIGMSYVPGNRFDRHRRQAWWPLVEELTVIEFRAEHRLDARWAAKREESRLIRSLTPLANRAEMPREMYV